eukprot:TRINITY_DN27856_c0_g1_i1.p3 TRINITY_DN27856_c0_g1~~TRINITY_DN27856_c0_g1_i1.p3  ORF type:complete len:150 (-),score=30.91 TRINITY_DN27856_c0_g1_i1:59-508(-)
MVKRSAEASVQEVFVMGADGVCQGVQSPPNPERPFARYDAEHAAPRTPSDEPMPEEEPQQPQTAKRFARCVSPASTAASTPELAPTTSPEARARASASELGKLPVRELKARLAALGADFAGLSEKTELVVLLEQLEFLHCPEKVPPFEL